MPKSCILRQGCPQRHFQLLLLQRRAPPGMASTPLTTLLPLFQSGTHEDAAQLIKHPVLGRILQRARHVEGVCGAERRAHVTGGGGGGRKPCLAARRRDSPSASGASWGRAPSCLQQGSSSSSRGCQEWGAAREAVAAAVLAPLRQSTASECPGRRAPACAPPDACQQAHCAIMEWGAPGRPAPAGCSSSIAETRKAIRRQPPASWRSCREHAASP